MFVLTVTVPGTFPFTPVEAHLTEAIADERAAEWLELGGATHVEVAHVADWTAKVAANVGLLAGLGTALGLETFDFNATGEETELELAA